MVRVGTAAAALLTSAIAWTSAGAVEANIAPRSWDGFYVGVTAGVGRGTSEWTSNFIVNTGEFSGSGTFFGITVGRNWQMGRWIYGVESDLSSSALRPITETGCAGLDCRTDLQWFGTVRGRLGYLLTPGLLVFGTAGISFGKFEHGIFAFTTTTNTEAGFVVGAGIEKMIFRKWTLKAEYLFLGFDAGNACTPVFCGSAVDSQFDVHVFRIGLNYHFGPSGPLQAPAARTPGWGGFYASVILGYGRGDTEWSDPSFGTTSGEFDGKGAIAGFGVGFSWQNARWIYGIESDAALTWIKAVSATPFCLCFSAEAEIKHLFTVRGRAGYLLTANTLIFVTGGLAVASLQFGNPNQGTGNAIEVGPTVGAGIEVRAAEDWTIKNEYLYASFGSSEACGTLLCFGALYSDHLRLHTVRFALNRYF